MPQILIPPPKPRATPEQLALQDRLIAACENGDEKAVTTLLKQGARPDAAGAPGWFSPGKQPLGAAVWGMCPDVVNALLQQLGGVASMTWQECKQHNLKHYKEVFIGPEFNPQTYGDWYELLQKMNFNTFIRTFHLKQVDKKWHNNDTGSWENLTWHADRLWYQNGLNRESHDGKCVFDQTEQGYASYRTQIKKSIESAIQPTLRKTFQS